MPNFNVISYLFFPYQHLLQMLASRPRYLDTAMNKDEAWSLTNHWVAAWNAHELELIMKRYEDGIELTSPEARGRQPACLSRIDQVSGSVDPTYAGAGTAARLGHFGACTADVERCVADSAGIALPSATPPGASRMDQG